MNDEKIYKKVGLPSMDRGGKWLGTARGWMQRAFRNGQTVIWGSHEYLSEERFCVFDIELFACQVAQTAVIEDREEIELEKKREKRLNIGQEEKIDKVVNTLYNLVEEVSTLPLHEPHMKKAIKGILNSSFLNDS